MIYNLIFNAYSAQFFGVLGAMGNGNNMDAATTPGAYFVNQNTGAGFPTGAYGYGHLIVAKSNQNPVSIVQIYVTSGRRGIYMRELYWGGSWNDWERIYDQSILNDSNILSPLASALGGMTYKSTTQPLDNVTQTGAYYATDITNSPENYYGLVVVFSISNFVIQFWVANDVARFYIRKRKNNGVWDSWQRIDNYGTSSLSELASALKPYL